VVRSEAGTNLTLPIAGIEALPDTGLLRKKGQFGNLPAGEAYLMPEEGKAEGILVVDGSMAGVGPIVEEPLRIRVEGGLLVEATGGRAEEFLKLIEPFGEPGRNVAELGVGTNDRARITGNILEDEKVLGTVHVAFGDNRSMGGTVNVASHLDGVLREPTLEVDGRVILEKGLLRLEG
jgi:leucyl aminopeptidase (aminopeptidase T)